MNRPITPDDRIDHSKFMAFMDEQVVFFSPVTIHQAIKELQDELTRRTEKDNDNS